MEKNTETPHHFGSTFGETIKENLPRFDGIDKPVLSSNYTHAIVVIETFDFISDWFGQLKMNK